MMYLKLYKYKMVYLAFFYALLLNYSLIAQEKKTFTFGDFWLLDYNLADKDGIIDVHPNLAKEGVIFKDSLLYMRDSEINQNLITKLLNSPELKSIMFVDCKIDLIWFDNFVVSKVLNFWRCKFTGPFWIKNSKFEKGVSFPGSDFDNQFFLIDSMEFKSDINFYDAIFNVPLTFSNTKFNNVNFRKVSFNRSININDCYFNKISFENSNFQKKFSLINIQFKSTLNLRNTKINDIPEFIRINFNDTVNFYRCNFLQGVDLRRNNFDSVKVVVLEDILYPVGRFDCYWEQLRGNNYPKISLNEYSKDGVDDFKRTERIYLTLRDNYNTIGYKDVVDDLMYELALQKELLVGGFWQSIYGFTLGYGYRPWRFIIAVVLPIIVFFSVIWYFFYFGIIVFIINPNFEEDLVPSKVASVKLPTSSKFIFKKKIAMHQNSKIDPPINLLTRLWFALFFSGSVLLSVRFKREWIKAIPKGKVGARSFIYMLTIEWIIGILLYIIFISLVLSSQFNTIKGIFGF